MEQKKNEFQIVMGAVWILIASFFGLFGKVWRMLPDWVKDKASHVIITMLVVLAFGGFAADRHTGFKIWHHVTRGMFGVDENPQSPLLMAMNDLKKNFADSLHNIHQSIDSVKMSGEQTKDAVVLIAKATGTSGTVERGLYQINHPKAKRQGMDIFGRAISSSGVQQ